jgi:hypothetical protein
MVTAHQNGTCFAWDVSALRARRADRWGAHLWDRLTGPHRTDHLAALSLLVNEPGRTVRLLESKLRPVPHFPRERIAQLGADSYDDRTRAEERLAEVLHQAEAQLRAAEPAASLEARLRLRRLLRPLNERNNDPNWLRQARAVEVLERIGTPAAVALLTKLSRGAPGAALTNEAAEALERAR